MYSNAFEAHIWNLYVLTGSMYDYVAMYVLKYMYPDETSSEVRNSKISEKSWFELF